MLKVCIDVALISGVALGAQVGYLVTGFRHHRYAGRHARWF
jgi:hypothetical protein